MPSKILNFTDAKNLPSDGPFVVESVEKNEGRITSITFADASGEISFRMKYQDYGVKVQVPAPPPTVKRTEIKATHPGLKVELPAEYFESPYDAGVRKRELADNGFEVTLTNDVEIPEPA